MNFRQNRLLFTIFFAVLLVAVAVYYPLPYYISQPGEAIELAPMIKVEDGAAEQGTFMLTTVRMSGANLIKYSFARWDEYRDLIPKEVLLAHYENEQEYTERQLQVMQSSKDTAISVAYTLANKEVHIQNKGVMVVSTIDNMPARDHFRFGDVITHIDDQKLTTAEELIQYIQNKKLGDQVTIQFIREENQEEEVTIQLDEMPELEGEQEGPRAGIGISTVTKRQLDVEPPVHIDTSRIGGPSAGLMFTLEIYNQLTEDDITKGYRIAGTGTVSLEGMVGPIGGIHQKIVAADRSKADIFFAPHEQGAEDSNYQRALHAAEDIGTKMKIVPVDTVQDAMDYLQTLPSKKTN